MRHYVITRFNCYPDDEFSASANTRERLFRERCLSEEWLNRRTAITERLLLPCLAKQTQRDFVWVVLLHAETPAAVRGVVESWLLSRASRIEVVLSSKPAGPTVTEFLASEGDDGTPLITTRVDSDDGVHEQFIEAIRGAASRWGTKRLPKTFDFANRWIWRQGEAIPSEFSCTSPFVSLVSMDRQHIFARRHSEWRKSYLIKSRYVLTTEHADSVSRGRGQFSAANLPPGFR